MSAFNAFREAVLHEEACDKERIDAKRVAEMAQNAHRKAQEARTNAYAAMIKEIKGG